MTLINIYMFQTLLEATCDGDLFLSNNNNHSNDDQDGISGCDSFGGDLDNMTTTINQNTSAVVKNVCILQMLLKVCSTRTVYLLQYINPDFFPLFVSVLDCCQSPINQSGFS